MSPSSVRMLQVSHSVPGVLQFAELIRRGGWSQRDLAGLAGENVLRVLEGAEKTAAKMKRDGAGPSMAIYEKRTDIKRNGSHEL